VAYMASNRRRSSQPLTGLCRAFPSRPTRATTPLGLLLLRPLTQGCSCLATLGLCDRTPLAFYWQETLRQAQGRASSGRDYPDSIVFRKLRERGQCL